MSDHETEAMLVYGPMAACAAAGAWGLWRHSSWAIGTLSAVGSLLPAVVCGMTFPLLLIWVGVPPGAHHRWVQAFAIPAIWGAFGCILTRQGLHLAKGAYARGRRDVGYVAYATFLVLLASLCVGLVTALVTAGS